MAPLKGERSRRSRDRGVLAGKLVKRRFYMIFQRAGTLPPCKAWSPSPFRGGKGLVLFVSQLNSNLSNQSFALNCSFLIFVGRRTAFTEPMKRTAFRTRQIFWFFTKKFCKTPLLFLYVCYNAQSLKTFCESKMGGASLKMEKIWNFCPEGGAFG